MAELPTTTPLEDAFESSQPDLQFTLEQQSSRVSNIALKVGKVALISGVTLFGAAAATQMMPYETSIAGIHTEVRVTTHPGINLDTSLGNLGYPHITKLPLGLSVRPKFDLGSIESAASDTPTFSAQAQKDVKTKLPYAIAYSGLIALGGAAAGGLVSFYAAKGIAADLEKRRLRKAAGMPDAPRNIKRPLAIWAGAPLGALITIGALGGMTYNHKWQDDLTPTGTIKDMMKTPQELSKLSHIDASGGTSKVQSLVVLQKITANANKDNTNPSKPKTAFNIALISDMHLRDNYPSLQPVLDYNNVNLIINTGDETETGTPGDLHLYPEYIPSIENITTKIPMLWTEGNHDSKTVAAQMAAIPGVTVLDHSEVNAFGLEIGGLADALSYTDGLMPDPQIAIDAAKVAANTINPSSKFDIILSHEPPAAETLADALGSNRDRLTISGHTHKQALDTSNKTFHITEGSTGRGGLFEIERNEPEEFSILSVGPDCQFTEITRYQIGDTVSDSHVQVIPLPKQAIDPNRTCNVDKGISSPTNW